MTKQTKKKPVAVKKTATGTKKQPIKKKPPKKPRSGDVYSINDSKTRGHKSLITSANKKETKSGKFKHLPMTHAPKTRKMKNIKLQENPDPFDKENKPSHILPKIQNSKIESLGKKHNKIKIKNSIDKSIIRQLKKRSKKK